jgi:hypothetical protein
MNKTRPHNRHLVSLIFNWQKSGSEASEQWLIEHSTSYQLLCYVDSFELRNPPLRKAANLYYQGVTNQE